MSDVQGALSRLTPEQRALLTERLRERRQAVATDDRITPRADQDHHPLSHAQERIWKLSRLRPNEPVYNLHEAKRLIGPLNVDALQRSVAEVVARHETLRATFTDVGGAPHQHIARPGDADVEVVEVRGGVTTALRIARREAERPFALDRDPLLRVRVLHLADDDHVLLMTAHHIVCDGASMGVIEAEISALYTAATTDTPADLPEPGLQYADVAHWRRAQGDDSDGVRYWAEQLGSGVERLRLPGDGGTTQRTAAGAHHSFTLSSAQTSAVAELSRTQRVTSFTTMTAAFLVLLHRHTGQEDLLVCSPVAGRRRRETQTMVGYFNNLVIMRGDLSGGPTFADVLRRLHPVVAAAFEHQDVPFQDVAALPHLQRIPLTRALFVLQDEQHRTLDLPGVDVTSLTVEAATADFDLGVFVRPDGDHMAGTVRYRVDQFDDADVTRLFERYVEILDAVVTTPTVPLAQLPSYAAVTVPAPAPAVALVERPRSAIESQLRDIWERLFGIRPISIHDDFFALGGHSLLAAELAAEVERHVTGSPLPLASLFTAPTIAQLATLLDEGAWIGTWSCLVPIKPTGTRPPLFFVHAHGGNVIGYRDLARHLPPEQPFYGLQAPDMQQRGAIEPRSVRDIARRYLDEARSVAPEGPYFFGGWCLGGDVAYEMAVQASDAGLEVPLVIMVDNPRPEHIATSTSGSALSRARNRVRTRAVMEWTNLTELGGRARRDHVVDRARHVARLAAVRVERHVAAVLGRTSVRVPASRAYRLEQIAEEHEKAYQDYDPPDYGGRVALFRAEQQPAGRANDQSLGWAAHIGAALSIHDVPGHRIGLLDEPRVGRLAARIVQAMDRALEAAHADHDAGAT